MSKESEELARRIRIEAVKMTAKARASHIGGALSAADVLAVLYSGILRIDPNQPRWKDRDRFILSKGHCCSALYAALALKGFFSKAMLDEFGRDGSSLVTHASHAVPGVELSTGSLGHGLPVGCGLALGAKRDGAAWRTFVMMSDGECDEGSTWEAALFAGHHGLDNLVVIIDCNELQGFGPVKDVLDIEPLAEKWKAFRWAVREIDGHDHAAITEVLGDLPIESGRPTAIIARTTKGKGVGFMEGKLEWHYRSADAEQLGRALQELGDS